MRILFVTNHYLKGVGGGVFASRGYIKAFNANADSFYLMYPVKNGYEAEDIPDGINHIPVTYDIPKYRKLFHLIKGKLHRYYNIFEEHISKIKPDLVVFDNSRCSDSLIDIAHKYNAQVITIHHNYEHEYYKDNARGIIRHIILFWIKKIESYAVKNSDLNLVLTKEDLKLLTENYLKNDKQKKFKLLGCFEYQDAKDTCDNSESPCKQRFVITGNLGMKQTSKSLKNWFKDYYPVLKRVLPESTLVIAGRNPTKDTKVFCKNNGIKLYDYPKDMLKILKEADYYICPTSLGGGLKLRIMDGLKTGLQVITHKVSARGYDMFENTGILHSYDSKESFEECIRELSGKQISKEEIKNIYKKHFSYNAGFERVRDILSSMK